MYIDGLDYHFMRRMCAGKALKDCHKSHVTKLCFLTCLLKCQHVARALHSRGRLSTFQTYMCQSMRLEHKIIASDPMGHWDITFVGVKVTSEF